MSATGNRDGVVARGCFRYTGAALIGTLLIALMPMPAHAWIGRADYAEVQVVVPDDATPGERLAADEFAAYWTRTTGAQPEIVGAPGAGPVVWIGARGAPERIVDPRELSDLGTDGFLIRTRQDEDPSIVIAGGGELGTQFGVYAFFEDYMGVRRLTADVTHIPASPPSRIPDIDITSVPAFAYRSTDYVAPWADTNFPRMLRLHPPEWGLFGHTAYELLPPEKYLQSNPEYYAQVSGRTVAPEGFDWRDPAARVGKEDRLGQLNFAHPEVAAAIVAELRARIDAAPQARFWSVSQMDWGNPDTSELSRAIDEREGGPSGSLLTCVNRVAEALAEPYPQVIIETLAHEWSQRPPRFLRPRENVAIRITTKRCDCSTPLDDSDAPANAAFVKDLRAWASRTDNLHVWDFAANLRCFLTPHPNIHTLQPNMQLYAANGVRGVHVQGAPTVGGEFAELRTYLISKLLWDPSIDCEARIDEFLRLYYQEAAPFIRAYLKLITERVRLDEAFVGVYDAAPWMDYETVEAADELFRRALDAVKSDEVRRRVALAHLPVKFAALDAPPKVRYSRTKFIVERPPSPTLDQFIAQLQELGVTLAAPGRPAVYVAELVGGSTPPRYRELALERLENQQFSIWVVPEASGSLLRWQVRDQGIDLLNGYATLGVLPGAMQDWTYRPGGVEGPVARSYEIARRSLESITLRAAAPNGLVVERRVLLERGSSELRIELTLSNPTTEPIAPGIRLRPEFHAPGSDPPEIWVDDGDRWTRLNADASRGDRVGSGEIDPRDYRRWAVWLPGLRLSVTNGFNGSDLQRLQYAFDLRSRSPYVTLELVVSDEPVVPGGTRTVVTTYEVSSKQPDRL